MIETKYVVVGSGIFGSVMADRIASVLGEAVTIIERRNAVGGNCRAEFDSETGIECHCYGSHIFHTSSRRVWEYLTQFTEFTPYRHKVVLVSGDRFYFMPVNLKTWSNTVEAAAINAHQTEDGKVVFYISTMLYQQWTTMRHSWTEFYGPCGHKTSDDPSGILQPPTIRGDFSVDFWRSAGKVIDYEMNRHTTTSFSTIGSGW